MSRRFVLSGRPSSSVQPAADVGEHGRAGEARADRPISARRGAETNLGGGARIETTCGQLVNHRYIEGNITCDFQSRRYLQDDELVAAEISLDENTACGGMSALECSQCC
jgi:hypothetical protein